MQDRGNSWNLEFSQHPLIPAHSMFTGAGLHRQAESRTGQNNAPKTHPWQEGVEAQDELTVPLEQLLDAGNNARGVDPAEWSKRVRMCVNVFVHHHAFALSWLHSTGINCANQPKGIAIAPLPLQLRHS